MRTVERRDAAVLLCEVIDRLQLALVHPPSYGDQKKSEWIQRPGHLVTGCVANRVSETNQMFYAFAEMPD